MDNISSNSNSPLKARECSTFHRLVFHFIQLSAVTGPGRIILRQKNLRVVSLRKNH